MSYHVTSEKKSYVEHKEGDVWEESGKTWTIKNGIKKTVTKMEALRKEIITPLACPKCDANMRSNVHRWAWNVYRMCFNCVVDMEHEITKAGKLEEYTKALYRANMESFYGDLEQFIEEFGFSILEIEKMGHLEQMGLILDRMLELQMPFNPLQQ